MYGPRGRHLTMTRRGCQRQHQAPIAMLAQRPDRPRPARQGRRLARARHEKRAALQTTRPRSVRRARLLARAHRQIRPVLHNICPRTRSHPLRRPCCFSWHRPRYSRRRSVSRSSSKRRRRVCRPTGAAMAAPSVARPTTASESWKRRRSSADTGTRRRRRKAAATVGAGAVPVPNAAAAAVVCAAARCRGAVRALARRGGSRGARGCLSPASSSSSSSYRCGCYCHRLHASCSRVGRHRGTRRERRRHLRTLRCGGWRRR